MASDAVTVPGNVLRAGAPNVGGRWGRYRLVEQLGAGGMGVVFAAHDPELDREVALKVVHDEHLGLAAQERLRREARALARVTHPNVVPVYEVGEHAGRTFYTMERVRGVSLSRWLATERHWRDVVRVFIDAGRGLAAIHAAQMAHRDVKPGNVLVGEDGRARIADLGIATSQATVPTSLQTTTTLENAGTPAYMAPEQLRGEAGDAVSDQFAFGLTLYEALGGARAFAADTATERLAEIERGPGALPSRIPRWLDAVVRRAIALDPADRYPTVSALVDDLARPRRRWVVAAAIGSVVLAGALGVAWWIARADSATCATGEELLAGTWDAEVRTRVTQAIAALDMPYAATTADAVVRDLEDYANRWIAAHVEICSATRLRDEVPVELMSVRMECLDARRAAMRALVGQLTTADRAVAGEAGTIVRVLPAIADCLHVTTQPRPIGREQLAAAYAHLAVGRLAAGKLAANEALAAARAAGDRAAIAEALVVRGRNEVAARELAAGTQSLSEGIADADVRVRVDAWNALSIALQRMGKLEEAERTIDLAVAAVGSLASPEREARVLETKGVLLGRYGRYDEARRHLLRSLELARGVAGPDSYLLRSMSNNLATVERRLGRLDEALAYAREGLRLSLLLGEQHPDVAVARETIGVVQSDRGQLDEAIRELELAVAIQRREGNTEALARLAGALGAVRSRQGKRNEALAHMREAVALREKVGGPEAQHARANLAGALLDIGESTEAEQLLRRTLEELRARLGAKHRDVAYTHRLLARALAMNVKVDDAVRELEAAARIYDPNHPDAAAVFSARADIERHRGRFQIALDYDRRSLAILERALPSGHTEIIDAQLALAEDLVRLGDARAAVPYAEAANADLGAYPRKPTAWITLAEALWSRNTGSDRARARELANRAHEAVKGTGIVDHLIRARVLAQVDRMK